MTTPWPRNPEFTALSHAVSAAAGRVLESAHPDYADAFRLAMREGADIGQALEAAGPLPGTSPFGPWRRILTTFTETEMGALQVRSALHLLRTTVPADLQNVVGTTPGAWVLYHVQAALMWLESVAEGARRLVTMLYRTCVRPTDIEWNAKGAAVAKPLVEISGRIEALRQRFTEEGWVVRTVEREQLWDGIVLAPGSLTTEHLWRYAAQFRKVWFRELDGLARVLIFTLERVCARILAEVQWEVLV